MCPRDKTNNDLARVNVTPNKTKLIMMWGAHSHKIMMVNVQLDVS